MSKQRKLKLPPGLRVRRGRIHYRFTVAGVEYAQTTGYTAIERNVTAASRKLEQARQAVEAGGSIKRLQPRRFSDAMRIFCDWKDGECREHPATATRVRTSMASLGKFFKGTMLHRITSGAIEGYKAWRRGAGIRDITIRHDLHAVSQLFQYAEKHQWAMGSPMANVKIPSDASARREHIVTPSEEQRYFEAARRKPVLYDVARLVLLTGMRPSEICGLLAPDVNVASREVVIRRGKTPAARRTITLPDEALEILGRRRVAACGGRLFWGERGGVKTLLNTLDDQHTKVIEAIAKQEGAEEMDWVLYELRHTFATRLAQDGCPLPVLAAILDHTDLRVVGRYVHPSQEAQRAAMLHYSRSGICPTPPSEKTDFELSGRAGSALGTSRPERMK
jgi:integrase